MIQTAERPSHILVTGAKSGLGRFLAEAFNAIALNRETDFNTIQDMADKKPFDLIIHCAVNHQREPTDEGVYQFLKDNLLLTETLTKLPHTKFTLISSVDVYSSAPTRHRETEPLKLYDDKNAYSQCKIFNEAIVRQETSNHIILRPSALLGIHSRPNSAIRIIQGLTKKLTLSGDSEFNYVTHALIHSFIVRAQEQNLKGTYNIASGTNITLDELANSFNKSIAFGNFKYETGNIDNSKAADILPELNKSSLDNLLDFAKGLT